MGPSEAGCDRDERMEKMEGATEEDNHNHQQGQQESDSLPSIVLKDTDAVEYDENDSIKQGDPPETDWRDDDFLSLSRDLMKHSKACTTIVDPQVLAAQSITDDTTSTAKPSPSKTQQQPSPTPKRGAPWNLLEQPMTTKNNGVSFTTSGVTGESFYLHNGIYRKVSPLVTLHNEIVNFVTLMSPLPEEVQQRESLIQMIQTFISNLFTEVDESGQSHSSCSISVFGSQTAGLILPSSDIDMVVFFNTSGATSGNGASNPILIDGKETDTPPDTSSSNIDYKPLIQMYEAFRDSAEWKDQLTYLELILESRIPLLKFTYGPSNISVDISMEQPLGPQAATLCLQYMDALPALRPLTMVLKYFLLARGLNEPFSGGMGSYALFLMIVSFLQQREREERQRNRSVSRKGSSHNNNASVGGMNLGGLLLDFLELYGFDFNYITAAISIRFDGRYFSKGSKDRKDIFWSASKTMSCGIENPLDKTMDVGKSTFRMHMIQRSFETAFRILLSRVSEPLPLIIAQKKMEEDVILDRGDGSILSSIIPPTEEMYQRSAKVRGIYVSMNGSAMNGANAQGYASQMKSSRSEKPLPRSDSDMSVSSNEGNPRGRSRSDNTRQNNNSKRHRSESRDRGYMERHGDGQRRKSYR